LPEASVSFLLSAGSPSSAPAGSNSPRPEEWGQTYSEIAGVSPFVYVPPGVIDRDDGEAFAFIVDFFVPLFFAIFVIFVVLVTVPARSIGVRIVVRLGGSKFSDVDDSQMRCALRARRSLHEDSGLFRVVRLQRIKRKSFRTVLMLQQPRSSPEHPLRAEFDRGSQRFPQFRIRTPAP
jgi:hypothetical protein